MIDKIKKVLHLASVIVAVALLGAGPAISQTSQATDDAIRACAAGSDRSFDADLVGGVADVYTSENVEGEFKDVTVTQLIELLGLVAEGDRLEVIRLYYECLGARLGDSETSSTDTPDEFDKIWVEVADVPDRTSGFLPFDAEMDVVRRTFPDCEFDYPNSQAFCRIRVLGFDTVTLGKGTASVVGMEWAGYRPPPSVIKKFSLAYGMHAAKDFYGFIVNNTSDRLESEDQRRSRMCLPGKFEAIIRTFRHEQYGEMHSVLVQEIADFCLT